MMVVHDGGLGLMPAAATTNEHEFSRMVDDEALG